MDAILSICGIIFSLAVAFALKRIINYIYEDRKCAEESSTNSGAAISTIITDGSSLIKGIGSNEENLSIYLRDVNIKADFERSENVKFVLGQIVKDELDETRSDNIFEKDIESLSLNLKTVWSSEKAWLVPLPWLEENILPPEDYFVQLDLEQLARDGFVTQGTIDLEDILKPTAGIDLPPKRILIRGEVGYGKTTLCIKLAQVWSTQRDSFLSKYQFALLFRFRDLRDGENFENQLVDEFRAYMDPDKSFDSVKAFVRSVADHVLLLLDGYDECKEINLESVHRQVLSTSDPNNVFFKSTVIVTSRPLLKSKSHLKYFSKHLKIVGLNETSRNYFLEKFFGEASPFLASLLAQLKVIHTSFGQSLSPFMLYLICYLYEERELVTFDTHLELLHKLLNVLGKRCCEREEDLRLSEDEIQMEYVKLGKVFYRSLRDGDIVIEQSKFDEIFIGDQTFVKRCGLLKKPLQLRSRSFSTAWEPAHKSFMEYLSYLYLKFCLDYNLESEKRLSFLNNLKLDWFDVSVLYKDQYEFQVIFTAVSGVRLCLTLSLNPEEDINVNATNFMMLNDDMYKSYHVNAGGCDILKVKLKIRENSDALTNKSLFPDDFSIEVNGEPNVLTKMLNCMKHCGLLNLKKPQHVFPEIFKSGERTLEKYGNLSKSFHLILYELVFGYNKETWLSFAFRLWTVGSVLMNTTVPFPIDKLERMSAATFFYALLLSLKEIRLQLDVVASLVCMFSFRIMCFYERSTDTMHVHFVDCFGSTEYRSVAFESALDVLNETLKGVIFFEADDDALSERVVKSRCRLSGAEFHSLFLFNSSVAIYEDPEECETKLSNDYRSDFNLKFDLKSLRFPKTDSLVLTMYANPQ